MGLFGPSKKELAEAAEYLKNVRTDIDKVVERFDSDAYRWPVEATLLCVAAGICQFKAPESYKKYQVETLMGAIRAAKNRPASDVRAVVTTLVDKISTVWNRCIKTGENPLLQIEKECIWGMYLNHEMFLNNPYFKVDVKRSINDTLDRMGIRSEVPFRFDPKELIPPAPRFFNHPEKAKTVTFQFKNGPALFMFLDEITRNGRKYAVLLEKGRNQDNDYDICEMTPAQDGTTDFRFVSDEEFKTLAEIYSKDVVLFGIYDSPLY